MNCKILCTLLLPRTKPLSSFYARRFRAEPQLTKRVEEATCEQRKERGQGFYRSARQA